MLERLTQKSARIIFPCLFSVLLFANLTYANECDQCNDGKPCRSYGAPPGGPGNYCPSAGVDLDKVTMMPADLQTPSDGLVTTNRSITFTWNYPKYLCCYNGAGGTLTDNNRRQRLLVDGQEVGRWYYSRGGGEWKDVGGNTMSFPTIQFPTTACGEHTWQVQAAACKPQLRNNDWGCWNDTPQGEPKPIWGDNPFGEWHVADSPVRTFVLDCCFTAPTIILGAPPDGVTYPANISPSGKIPMFWIIRSECRPERLSYNTITVWNPDGQEVPVDGSPTSTVGTQNTSHYQYPNDYKPADVYKCNKQVSIPQLFKWQVNAANINSDNGTNIPASSAQKSFTIAPNYVAPLDSNAILGCYSSNIVSFPISVRDLNMLDDTYTFTLSDSQSGVVYTDAMPQGDCHVGAIPDVYECDVKFTNVDPGVYDSFTFRTNSSCGLGDELPLQLPDGGLTVGTNTNRSLELSPTVESDFTLKLEINDGLAPDGTVFSFDYSVDASCGPTCGSCPDSSWRTLDTLAPSYPEKTCTVYTPLGGTPLCETGEFTFPAAGRYCFKATAPGYMGCGGQTRTNQAEIYVLNIKLTNDVNNDIACNSTTAGQGEVLADELIEVDDGYPDSSTRPFQRYTDAQGSVRFTLNLASATEDTIVTTSCAGGDNDDDNDNSKCTHIACWAFYTGCAGMTPGGVFAPNITLGQVRFDGSINVGDPQEYNIYLRSRSRPAPEEWFTAVNGDAFAPGMNGAWCSDPTTAGALFDGSLLERPEGHPLIYGKGPPQANRPYTGGYLFSQYIETSGWEIERGETANPVYFLSEPNPLGRYALAMPVNFMDSIFAANSENYENTGIFPLPNSAITNTLTSSLDSNSSGFFVTDDFNALVAGGSYTLGSESTAFVFYTGADPIVFDRTFTNTRGREGSLVIIAQSDVEFSSEIGQPCSWDPVLESGTCGTGGEYGPTEASFPADVDATIITYGKIVFDQNLVVEDAEGNIDMSASVANMRVVKINGSLIGVGTDSDDAVGFARVLGRLSSRYPGETVLYDPNLLYRGTELIRLYPLRGGIITNNKLEDKHVHITYGY